MTYGVNSAGFTAKSLLDVETEIDNQITTTVGVSANRGSATLFGQLKTINASGVTELWELATAVYNNTTILASGTNLDLVYAMQGKSRQQAISAQIKDFALTVSGNLNLSAGTTFSKDGDSDVVFSLDEEFDYTHTATSTTTQRVDITAVTAGEIDVATDSITVIENPIANLDSVSNDSGSSFVQGINRQTDSEIRIDLQTDPFTAVSGTDSGIRRSVLSLNAVVDNTVNTINSCFVIENRLHVFDSDGRPPHSTEVIVYYEGSASTTTDEAVAAKIANSISDGSQPVSTTGNSYSTTVTLDSGNTRDVTFSRPSEVPIYVIVKAKKSGSTSNLTTDEKSALKTWIADWGNDLNVGDDIIVNGRNGIASRINDFGSAEIIDNEISISKTSPAPAPVPGTTDANIDILYSEKSTWTTTNITISDF